MTKIELPNAVQQAMAAEMQARQAEGARRMTLLNIATQIYSQSVTACGETDKIKNHAKNALLKAEILIEEFEKKMGEKG